MTHKLLKLTFQPWRRGRQEGARFLPQLTVTLAVLAGCGLLLDTNVNGLSAAADTKSSFSCVNPHVVDGDTFNCAGGRVRLQGIDAPEMAGHCRPGRSCVAGDPLASRDYLMALTRNDVVCRPVETDHYGRTVARCIAGGRDLSCAMVEKGYAVRRYDPINCP